MDCSSIPRGGTMTKEQAWNYFLLGNPTPKRLGVFVLPTEVLRNVFFMAWKMGKEEEMSPEERSRQVHALNLSPELFSEVLPVEGEKI